MIIIDKPVPIDFQLTTFYSGRKAARVKVSVALLNSFFTFGVAMGREIRLRASSYCSRSRFCTRLARVKFSSGYEIL